MNVSTKQYLFDLLEEAETWERQQERIDSGNPDSSSASLNMAIARINDARKLVEAMPDNP